MPISAAGQAVDPVTPRRVAEFLQNAGHVGKIEKSDITCRVHSNSGGNDFFVYFDPPSGDETAEATTIKIESTFRLGKDEFEPFLRICNQFNGEFRFGKASVTQEGIFFQMDFPCIDGASIVSLGNYLATYRELLHVFLDKLPH